MQQQSPETQTTSAGQETEASSRAPYMDLNGLHGQDDPLDTTPEAEATGAITDLNGLHGEDASGVGSSGGKPHEAPLGQREADREPAADDGFAAARRPVADPTVQHPSGTELLPSNRTA